MSERKSEGVFTIDLDKVRYFGITTSRYENQIWVYVSEVCGRFLFEGGANIVNKNASKLFRENQKYNTEFYKGLEINSNIKSKRNLGIETVVLEEDEFFRVYLYNSGETRYAYISNMLGKLVIECDFKNVDEDSNVF